MNISASSEPLFFVTPQAANLMQDLSRQLMQGDDVCVLHGQPGCGKTRLLQYFKQHYLASREVQEVVVWEDGVAWATDAPRLDAYEFTQKVLEPLPQRCLLILDQMENADDRLREALFRFWQTDGIRRRCRLLISARGSGLKNIASAAEHSRIHLLSIELQPWGKREVRQFLNRRLCGAVDEQVEVNSELRRQLKSARGLPGLVEQLAQRLDGQTNCRSQRRIQIRYLLVIILAGVAVSTLYWSKPALLGSLDAADIASASSPGVRDSKERSQVNDASAGLSDQMHATKHQDSSAIKRHQLADVDLASTPGMKQNINPGENSIAQDAGSKKPDGMSNAAAVDGNPGSRSSSVDTVEGETLLGQRVQATRNWLAKSGGNSATIQIMSVAYQTTAARPLESFLNQLVDAGVDVEKLFVYQLERDSRHIFVVLYGEFENRRAAFGAIKALPQELNSNDPIPRTVNSIKVEISAPKTADS